MALANCNLNTLAAAAKCFDCLSLTEKRHFKVRFMALALKAAGGPDFLNPATLAKTVECFTCLPDFRLDSMEVAVWQNLAQNFGAAVPPSVSAMRAVVKCAGCGEQKTTRAAWLYLLCQLTTVVQP